MNEKKIFVEPSIEVEKFTVEDVLTTSGDNNNWGGGETPV